VLVTGVQEEAQENLGGEKPAFEFGPFTFPLNM